MIIAPAVTIAGRALVVSATATCGGVSGLALGNPFTQLPPLNGEDAAYYIAPAAGTYGAAWASTSGTWNASTVDFR